MYQRAQFLLRPLIIFVDKVKYSTKTISIDFIIFRKAKKIHPIDIS